MAIIRDTRGQRYDDDNRGRQDDDHPNDNPPGDGGPDNCKDGKRQTDKSIQRERYKICDELKTRAGEVLQYEETRKGNHQLYDDRLCSLVATEKNYLYYRNLELMVGMELLQVNEGLKEHVGTAKKWNDEITTVLKEVVKTVKEAKDKVRELKEAASKLNTCINDSCQSTQKRILTGQSSDNCPPDKDVEDKCNSKDVIQHLEDIPVFLLQDMNIIFNSATRVAGIHNFSNVTTLEPLQKTLQEKSKAFDDFVVEKMKKGSDDVKKAQEEVGKTVIELSKTTSILYFKRSDYKGLKWSVKKLCKCKCDCITANGPDGPADEGRLEKCKCQICDICEDVKTGECKKEDPGCPDKFEKQNKQTN